MDPNGNREVVISARSLRAEMWIARRQLRRAHRQLKKARRAFRLARRAWRRVRAEAQEFADRLNNEIIVID